MVQSVPHERAGRLSRVLISENYWQRRFAGDPALLDRTIRLNGVAFTVVGITPHDFVGTGTDVPDFWLPLNLKPRLHPDSHLLSDRENRSSPIQNLRSLQSLRTNRRSRN